MCIILVRPEGGAIDAKELRTHQRANPDGWGMMIVHDDMVHGYKSMNAELCEPYYDNFSQYPHAIHFRTASAGGFNEAACHPHTIRADELLMHNGNFFELSQYFPGTRGRETDSQRMAAMLGDAPEGWLDNPEICKALEAYCQNNMSKMVVAHKKGFTIFNEQAGFWQDGTWHSNGGLTDYVGYGFSGAYEYQAGDVRHKGGLITPWMFDKVERDKWKCCPVCEGSCKGLTGICKGCQSYKELTALIAA